MKDAQGNGERNQQPETACNQRPEQQNSARQPNKDRTARPQPRAPTKPQWSIHVSGAALGFGGRVRDIESTTNTTFHHCRELLGGRGIREHGEAILSGSEFARRFSPGFATMFWAG